jgi:hypothetical protein
MKTSHHRVTAVGRAVQILLSSIVIACLMACGGDGDSSGGDADDELSSPAATAGRWKVETIRMFVPKPLLLRFDTATGETTFRETLGRGAFVPLAKEIPPGVKGRVEPGHFVFDVMPDRKGSFIIRTDTKSGRIWNISFSISTKVWRDLKAPTDPNDPGEVGKFEISLVPGRKGLAAVRTNTITGEVYIYHLRDPGKKWQRVRGATSGGEKKRSPGLSREKKMASARTQEVPDMDSIVDVLHDEESTAELRAIMVTLLGKHYPGDSVDILLVTLADEDPQVVLNVIATLPSEKSLEVATALEGLSDHPNADVVKAARQKVRRMR